MGSPSLIILFKRIYLCFTDKLLAPDCSKPNRYRHFQAFSAALNPISQSPSVDGAHGRHVTEVPYFRMRNDNRANSIR